VIYHVIPKWNAGKSSCQLNMSGDFNLIYSVKSFRAGIREEDIPFQRIVFFLFHFEQV